MHPFQVIKGQSFVWALCGWIATPLIPLFIGLVPQLLGLPRSQTLKIVEVVSSVWGLVLVFGSIWGAAKIEQWLEEVELPFLGLIFIPFAALHFVAYTGMRSRTPQFFMGEEVPTGESFSLMLAIWALLIAYQAKPFWDHAKTAWRKEGARAVWRGTGLYGRYMRFRVKTRRSLREAGAWQAKGALQRLATPEQASLDVWLESARNRWALRKLRPRPSPFLVLFVIGVLLMLWGTLAPAKP